MDLQNPNNTMKVEFDNCKLQENNHPTITNTNTGIPKYKIQKVKQIEEEGPHALIRIGITVM